MLNSESRLIITENIKLSVAVESALQAGSYLKHHFGEKNLEQSEKESHHSIVTKHDLASQEIICEYLTKAFAEYSIVAEEKDNDVSVKNGTAWIIDPIDGSSYFARGIDTFCIAIGLMEENEMQVGVVYSPIQDELFYAVKNKGAYLDKSPIRVSNIKQLNESIFNAGNGIIREDAYRTPTKQLFQQIRSMRAGGSCAQELCNIACGRIDGLVTLSQHVWDYSAAGLILEEAGGCITDFKNEKINLNECILEKVNVLATNTFLHSTGINLFG